jgi:Cytochrome c biogenesis factor
VDPARGTFILGILVIFIGGSLALFAWRAPMLQQGGLFAPISRESALVVNNLFLATACATVFVGTLYPLALEVLTGDKISVGAPFFNATFLPLILPLLLLLPFGQTLAWKRGNFLGTAQRLYAAFGLSLLVALVILAYTHGGPVGAPFGIGLGVFLILGSLNEIVTRSWTRGKPLSIAWAKARGLPRSTWGTVIAHAGVGLVVLGISATAWDVETLGTLKTGERLGAGPYELRLEHIVPRQADNYREDAALFRVFRNGREVGTVESMKRLYVTRGMPTTEAGILTSGLSQVYVSLGEMQPDGSLGVRLYYKPLVLLIWLGAVVMALGGALSLTDRRLRIAAPARAKAGPAAPVPAE